MNQPEHQQDDNSPSGEEITDAAADMTAVAAGETDQAVAGDDRTAALEAELARMKDHMLRALADSENLRKRAQREREDAGKFAIAAFARDLLGFADNFGRAVASIPAELKEADERIAGVITGIEAMEKELLT